MTLATRTPVKCGRCHALLCYREGNTLIIQDCQDRRPRIEFVSYEIVCNRMVNGRVCNYPTLLVASGLTVVVA